MPYHRYITHENEADYDHQNTSILIYPKNGSIPAYFYDNSFSHYYQAM